MVDCSTNDLLAVLLPFAAALTRLAWDEIRRRKTMIQTKQLLTLPEVAAHLCLTYTQALRTVERGYFEQVVTVGKRRHVRVEDLERFRVAARKAGYEGAARG